MITFNVPDNLCSFILPLVKLKVEVKHLNNETTVSDSEYWVSKPAYSYTAHISVAEQI